MVVELVRLNLSGTLSGITLSLVWSFLPWAKKETAVALSIAFVADDSKTTAERRFKRLAIAVLHGERKVSLLGILLPLVDGVRDGDAFDDFDWLGFTAQYTRHPVGAQPPLRV